MIWELEFRRQNDSPAGDEGEIPEEKEEPLQKGIRRRKTCQILASAGLNLFVEAICQNTLWIDRNHNQDPADAIGAR